MNAKIENAVPQRISVPEGTVLRIYARDANGNRMLKSLPGPVDISIVPIEGREIQ
jgi:stringent starvation protein B